MLVKFFAHSKNAVGCLEYLYSDKDHKGELRSSKPQTLQGDPDLTQELINRASEKYKHCYTAGCLSFAERNIAPTDKEKIMAEFEQALLPGMRPDEYNILWVEHMDKGRLELNFVVPKINTDNEQNLHTYYKFADERRIDAWKDYINASYDLADPKEPKRERLTTTAHNLPKKAEEIKKSIDKYLLGAGVENRDDVIKYLNEIEGLEVKRTAPTSVSIKVPQHGKNIRLTGGMYEQSYERNRTSEQSIEEAQRGFERDREDRARKAYERYIEYFEKASKRNREKHDRLSEKARRQSSISSRKTREESRDMEQSGGGSVNNSNSGHRHYWVEDKQDTRKSTEIKPSAVSDRNHFERKITEVFTNESSTANNNADSTRMGQGQGSFERAINQSRQNNQDAERNHIGAKQGFESVERGFNYYKEVFNLISERATSYTQYAKQRARELVQKAQEKVREVWNGPTMGM